jgi:homoserine O-acetyltransferase
MKPPVSVSADTLTLGLDEPFLVEGGATLAGVRIAYRTWGRLVPGGDNTVLVCHALTGSPDVDAWWPGVLGAGSALDPTGDFVVCANVLGGCHGTTGPTTIDPTAGRPYGPDFPALTVRDIVRAQALLLDRLGVGRLRLLVGGSFGGMQALEWVATYPDRVEAAVIIAAPARQSAWAIALSHAQRAAIAADPRFRAGRYSPSDPPASGLAVARMIAMCSYRSRESLEGRFGRDSTPDGGFEVEHYLHRHGEKLVARFDANTYVTLTRAMDSHDVGRGRGGVAAALRAIPVPALVVAIDSDVLFPAEEQWELVEAMPRARLAWLASPHGHDAFLIETDEVNRLILRFRAAPQRRTA